jgi:hypothetical protein
MKSLLKKSIMSVVMGASLVAMSATASPKQLNDDAADSGDKVWSPISIFALCPGGMRPNSPCKGR